MIGNAYLIDLLDINRWSVRLLISLLIQPASKSTVIKVLKITLGLNELSSMSLIDTGRLKVNCTEMSWSFPSPFFAFIMLEKFAKSTIT